MVSHSFGFRLLRLRFCTLDISHIDVISDELGRRRRNISETSKLVLWVQRVARLSSRFELNGLWTCAFDIVVFQLVFDSVYCKMQLSWC